MNEKFTIPNPCPVCGREANEPIPFCPRCNYGIEESCPEFVEDMNKYFPSSVLNDIASLFAFKMLDDLMLKEKNED